MLDTGDRLPDFTARTTDGRTLTAKDLAGRPTVFFFFPKAFTGGWTREASQFRDAYPEVKRLGAEVIGVSTDGHDTQCSFAGSLDLPYPLVGDEDQALCKKFGVLWPLVGVARRATFVVDGAGVVRGAYTSELKPESHAPEALRLLRELAA